MFCEHMVCLRKCSMHAWEECVFYSVYISKRSIWSTVMFKPGISWLILCLNDVSFFERGALKSSNIIALLLILPYIFSCFNVGCINTYKRYIFLMDWHFYYHIMNFSFIIFNLKSILSDIRIATSAIFGYHLHEIFFPSLHSQSYVS